MWDATMEDTILYQKLLRSISAKYILVPFSGHGCVLRKTRIVENS